MSTSNRCNTYAVVTFLAMPFPMSWRPHLHTFAYIARRHTSRTAMALRWRWEIWASQVLTTPLIFFGQQLRAELTLVHLECMGGSLCTYPVGAIARWLHPTAPRWLLTRRRRLGAFSCNEPDAITRRHFQM